MIKNKKDNKKIIKIQPTTISSRNNIFKKNKIAVIVIKIIAIGKIISLIWIGKKINIGIIKAKKTCMIFFLDLVKLVEKIVF
ncbi:MAG: hypothetical protein QXY79_01330, partial [Candidatus Methanomethylicia archaeon]